MSTLLLLPPLALLSICLLLVTLVALSYRRSFLEAIKQREAAEAKAQHWFSTSRGYSRLTSTLTLTEDDVQRAREMLLPDTWLASAESRMARQRKKVEEIEARVRAAAAGIPIGTPANPIITPNGDSARYSTVEDLLK